MNKNPNPATRFKKGKSGNPDGARKHNQEKKALKRFTKELYRELIEKAFATSIGEIQELLNDKQRRAALSPMEFTILSALMNGAKKGDPQNAELFATRIIGKIPDIIKVDSVNLNANTEVKFDRVKDILKKIESEM